MNAAPNLLIPTWSLIWALLSLTLPTLMPPLVGVICSWCMTRTSETFGFVTGLIAAAGGFIPFTLWALWFVGSVEERYLQETEAFTALTVLLVVQVVVVVGACWYANRR